MPWGDERGHSDRKDCTEKLTRSPRTSISLHVLIALYIHVENPSSTIWPGSSDQCCTRDDDCSDPPLSRALPRPDSTRASELNGAAALCKVKAAHRFSLALGRRVDVDKHEHLGSGIAYGCSTLDCVEDLPWERSIKRPVRLSMTQVTPGQQLVQ